MPLETASVRVTRTMSLATHNNVWREPSRSHLPRQLHAASDGKGVDRKSSMPRELLARQDTRLKSRWHRLVQSKRSAGWPSVAQFRYRSSSLVPRPLLTCCPSPNRSVQVYVTWSEQFNVDGALSRLSLMLLVVSHERYVSESSDYAEEALQPLVATASCDVRALTDARNAL